MTTNSNQRLPAEWEQQCAVMVSWPHKHTDWAYMLDEITECYARMVAEMAKRATVIVACPKHETAKEALKSVPGRIIFIETPTNDTWIRDYGPITTIGADGYRVANDFVFNGWGLKFASNLDNRVTRDIISRLSCQLYADFYEGHLDFVLEGGAIDTDGQGALLTTRECMESPNRNAALSERQIINRLKKYFGCKEVIYLLNGYLEGDDTDSHVDTLARFLPGGKIAYTACDREDDPHYEALKLMESELKATGRKLVPLPIPEPICDEYGLRLPATYANFLFLNGAVLLPVYADSHYDSIAAERLRAALPEYEIVTVDCRALIRQHGSLHCATMQLPDKP